MPPPDNSSLLPLGGVLPIAPALTVAADQHAWDWHTDVLVIGLGAAGAAAAIAARDAGVDVRVVERFEGGGATARSGGVVYAGGGTAQQKALGFEDTPEQMFAYLRQETGDAVGEATLRRFCEDSPALIAWLESLGADFRSSAPPPKTSYPKDGVYLYYSGNETVPEYAALAKAAPRGHRTRGSWLSGAALFGFLRAKVVGMNVPIATHTAAQQLLTDARGAVIGAVLRQLTGEPAARYQKLINKAEKVHNFSAKKADVLRAQANAILQAEGKLLQVRANLGVVLTTGGFIFNREMVRAHAPKYLRTMRLGATGCDGSGIRLGESVGGVPARMDKVSAWRFINPPHAWPSGIAVGKSGARFCNEQVYGAKLGVEMCESQGGAAWLIVDAAQRWTAIKEALFGKLWFFQSVPALILMLFAPRAKTIAALAAKVGMDAAGLERTVAAYNQGCVSGDDALGKSTEYLHALQKAPFYALNISADSRSFPCPAITLGGLKVNEASGAVQRADGSDIPGLYAAGRCAVGIASNRYVSGLSIADCLWSGLRAGRSAARSAPAAIKP